MAKEIMLRFAREPVRIELSHGVTLVIDPDHVTKVCTPAEVRELPPEPGDTYVRRELTGRGSVVIELDDMSAIKWEIDRTGATT